MPKIKKPVELASITDIPAFAALRPRHLEVARLHVMNPNLSQTECYRQVYPNASIKTGGVKASNLFRREDFKSYISILKSMSNQLLQNNPYYHGVLSAIKDPQGMEAAQIRASLIGDTLTDLAVNRESQIVIEATGRGYSEARLIERPMSAAEKTAARKLVLNALDPAKMADAFNPHTGSHVTFVNHADEAAAKALPSNADILAEFESGAHIEGEFTE